MTFGAFISTRRKEAKLNLRDTAKHLGISNGYLCDIEQGRRPAPEGAFVERISSFLELDKQEHEMLLDLAADSRQTVPADLPDYTRQKVLSTSERITTLTAELNDGNSKIEEMKAEFNRIVSWSKIFDESPMEVKKMICGYIIKKVSVFRDYRVKIEFNINVEQFLNGIDSIDECATYELPMAQ